MVQCFPGGRRGRAGANQDSTLEWIGGLSYLVVEQQPDAALGSQDYVSGIVGACPLALESGNRRCARVITIEELEAITGNAANTVRPLRDRKRLSDCPAMR